MKKTFQYILIGLALTAVMAGCNKTVSPVVDPDDVVDLRYRAESEYNLDAISPKPFVITVKSTKHPHCSRPSSAWWNWRGTP